MSQIQVIDEYSNIHILTDKLGEGGQGVVYRTRDSNIAVKLVTNEGEPVKDDTEIVKNNKRFEQIRLLPIPAGLQIAMPSTPLKGNAGYVMRLLSEMIPFSSFGFTYQHYDIGNEITPFWLVQLSEKRARQILYYWKTGGLRRRLLALSQAASILARLHSRGLVYVDISPNNIFVSDSLDTTLVWFIDADNLRYEGGSAHIYTPGFGAPEVVQGMDVCSSFSDCYAFACLAFWMLTMQHPFEGKALTDDEIDEEDWDDDPTNGPQQKAWAGLLPFIDDPDDDSNRAGGLPRKLFLNTSLAAFFEKTFCTGRRIPEKRPSALLWARELAAAADQCIVCNTCGMSYYYTEDICPYCDTVKPRLLVAKGYRPGAATAEKPRWIFVRELTDKPIALPQRLFYGFSAETNGATELELNCLENILDLF
ncbi:MAG: hypothetical protein LBH32_12105 [Dysgonamonadaceae bacterium]|jgi:serine/threonine protein kinase|nr:hypothetical protein [Dysgonamonadaceae bacterium]